MTEDSKPTSATAKSIPSLLENLVEIRFLILLLCFAFYSDSWLVKHNVDPTTLSIEGAYQALLSSSVFSCLMFIGSYSVLMVGFFPTSRKIIGLIRMYLQSKVSITNCSREEKQLADWSMAFVFLSFFSGIQGYFSPSDYNGLALYIFNFLKADGLIEGILRISVICLWLYCLALSAIIDEP